MIFMGVISWVILGQSQSSWDFSLKASGSRSLRVLLFLPPSIHSGAEKNQVSNEETKQAVVWVSSIKRDAILASFHEVVFVSGIRNLLHSVKF